MRRPEQAIHKAVVSHLRMRSEPRVFFFHPANGGKRLIIEARIFKALGVIAGVPDLIILKAGEVFGLELKATRGVLTPSQRLVHAAMREAGAETAVAHSLDEALATLEFWGVLKKSVSNRVSGHSKDHAEAL